MRSRMLALLSLLGLALAAGHDAAPADADTYKIVLSRSFRYGNWGGSGFSNGKEGGNPRVCTAACVDDLDRAFMDHDQAYAAADDKFGPQRIAAIKKAKGDKKAKGVKDVEKRWKKAYRLADALLALDIRLLPVLIVKKNGSDNWNGWKGTASKKPTWAQRMLVAGLTDEVALSWLMDDPPYAKHGG
jgi:hypothetical protein